MTERINDLNSFSSSPFFPGVSGEAPTEGIGLFSLTLNILESSPGYKT
jgi:hypothetical protein